MQPSQRIVTRLPLAELWNDEGIVSSSRYRDLVTRDITSLLRMGAVEFVVADVGHPLQWIPAAETFRFWKSEVKIHITDPNSRARLGDFPGAYFYYASEWRTADEKPIIVLEKS